MSDQERIDELLELAVLGEITPEQEAELDAALADNADLAAELDADLAVAASLQSLHAEPPPERLKADVMAAIDALEAEELYESSSVSSSTVVDFAGASSARTARRARWQPLAAAAAVVMLLVGGVIVATRGTESGPTVSAVAEAADGRARTLEGDLSGRLDVVFSPSQQAFVLVGSDIPALSESETYQLWFVDDSGAQSIGLFRPDELGRVEQLYRDLDPTDFVVGVTVEPATGSDVPTLPLVASA